MTRYLDSDASIRTLFAAILAPAVATATAAIGYVLIDTADVGGIPNVATTLLVGAIVVLELGYPFLVLFVIPSAALAIALSFLPEQMRPRSFWPFVLAVTAVTIAAAVPLYQIEFFAWLTASCADEDCTRMRYFEWAQHCLWAAGPAWCHALIENRTDPGAAFRAASEIAVLFGATMGFVFWLIRRPDRDAQNPTTSAS